MGKKIKIQGTPTPVKCYAAKGVRSKAKKGPESNSLPGNKVVFEKDMHLTINALLLQNFLNANMKEWGNTEIEVASNLRTECRTVMHVIKDVVNDRDSKAKEGTKNLETSWEGLTSSI